MNKKIILLFLMICTISYSQDFKKNATAGFVFLELPVTARSAGMGESSISYADMNSSGLFVNPASLGFSNQTHSFSVTYSPWIADIKHYVTTYALKTDYGVFGFGAILLDYGSMQKTKKIQGQRLYEVLGTFNSNSLAIGLSYSKQLTDKFSFGVTGKYVRESIDIYSASNYLFDGGILYYTGLASLRIAATISNFGVDAKFINDKFKMPAMLRLGVAAEVFGGYDQDYRVTASAEAIHPNDGDEKVNVGTEISYKNMIDFRAGYKFFYDEESYSFGIGVKTNLSVPMQLDFAYSDYGRLGDIIRFTLQVGVL
ncbi:MAG: PorV/PorQ family protein [bacterium]